MAGTTRMQGKRRRTWSLFGDIRRVPTEYEIVTAHQNWTVRKQRSAPLEANSSIPQNLWLLTYRDRSPLQAPDWDGFRDPDELTYRKYVTLQDDHETMVRGLFDDYAGTGHDQAYRPEWVETLLTLFSATRFPGHAVQLCHSYLGQMAPNSYISNCAAFAAADMLRRVSLVAYRTRELQLAHPDGGFGAGDRAAWETAPEWQGARRALEQALIAYDWGECFVAVNLVLRPTLDDILLRQLGEVARANADDLTFLLLADLSLDAARCRRWSTALAGHAVACDPANIDRIDRWVRRWAPRADAAAEGLASLLERLPEVGRAAEETVRGAQRARTAELERAGLTAR